MNNTMNWLALLVATCVLAGCEQTVTDAGSELYAERLVVNARLLAGQPIDSIQFTRTLPLTEPYTAEAAALTDVDAAITVDGNAVALQSIGGGYYQAPGLTAQSGKTYSLVAHWHGGTSTAQTTVPRAPVVDTIEFGRTTEVYDYGRGYQTVYYGLDVEAGIEPDANQVFAAIGDSLANLGVSSFQAYGSSSPVQRRRDTLPDGRIHAQFRNSVLYSDSTVAWHFTNGWVLVAAYDAQYYDYAITRPRGYNSDDGPFSIGGTPQTVRWNVTGAGIGLFIGEATTKKHFGE